MAVIRVPVHSAYSDSSSIGFSETGYLEIWVADPNDDFLYYSVGFDQLFSVNAGNPAVVAGIDMQGEMILRLPGRPAIDLRGTNANLTDVTLPIIGDFPVFTYPYTSMFWVHRVLPDGSTDTAFLELAGDPLPNIGTYAEFMALMNGIPDGFSVFDPKFDLTADIPFLSLPGATVVAGNATGILDARPGTVPVVLTGGALDDTLTGGDSNDSVFGGSGADLLYGGGFGAIGNDSIDAGDGHDWITAGEGNDTIQGGGGDDLIDGGNNSDLINDTSGNDAIYAGHDDDTVNAGSGEDLVKGEHGNDILSAGEGADAVFGGEGNDRLNSGAGNDLAYGGTGNDTLYGDGGNNKLFGDEGIDLLIGGLGNELLFGGGDNDLFLCGQGTDLVYGGAGTGDRVQYTNSGTGLRVDLQVASTNTGLAAGDQFQGVEDIFGSFFGDSLLGNAEANVIFGDAGNDAYLDGRVGNDTIFGGTGNDVLIGGWGGDRLDGGAGSRDRAQYTDASSGLRADLLVTDFNTGFAAGDSFIGIEDLFGSFRNDVLLGDSSGNIIWGAAGADQVFGRSGNDTLLGGAGNDTLAGGADADLFIFQPTSAPEADLISDFADGLDRIQILGASGFSALGIAAGQGGALITFGAQTILVTGVSETALTAADFLFA